MSKLRFFEYAIDGGTINPWDELPDLPPLEDDTFVLISGDTAIFRYIEAYKKVKNDPKAVVIAIRQVIGESRFVIVDATDQRQQEGWGVNFVIRRRYGVALPHDIVLLNSSENTHEITVDYIR